jgi:D-threo-aldose 1-dehydrogenase
MARCNEKVKLKRSDLEVTRLSLGTAPLGGLFKSVSDADGEALLNSALEIGRSRTMMRKMGEPIPNTIT